MRRTRWSGGDGKILNQAEQTGWDERNNLHFFVVNFEHKSDRNFYTFLEVASTQRFGDTDTESLDEGPPSATSLRYESFQGAVRYQLRSWSIITPK